MNSISSLYIALIAISYLLAFVHFATWFQNRNQFRHNLLFAIVAISSATLSLLELKVLHLDNIPQYELFLKYYHLPLAGFLVSLVWFIHTYFKTANTRLAILFTALWGIGLLINFLGQGNFTFYNVEHLVERPTFFGEPYVHAVINPKPWRHIADIASVVYLVYMTLATVRAYKAGMHERALLVGGSAILFILISGIIAPLSDLSLLKIPPVLSLPFIFMVIAMSIEQIREVVRASRLTTELSLEKNKWNTLVTKLKLPVVGVDKFGAVNYINPYMQKLLGFSKEEIIGKKWIDTFVLESEQELLKQKFQIPLNDTFPTEFQNSVKNKEGKEIILKWSNVGITNESKELIGITAVGNDVTEKENSFREIIKLKEQLELENQILKESIEDSPKPDDIICESNSISYAFNKANQVTKVDTTVLLEGETGVGKGVFAKYIHNNSNRKDNPFVVVNCAAIPETLLESELFGYEKGAFTGAIKQKKGRFELANEGTLFLDEIGDFPLSLQAKLLRVLQDGYIERLGGEKSIKINTRLITATNKTLSEEVRKGNFRSDLFYRLNVFPITIPPLRKRKEDIPQLIEYFANHFKKKYDKKFTRISKQTYTSFIGYHWPGNIRELQNIIERAVISVKGEVLKTNGLLPVSGEPDNDKSSFRKLEEVERDYILQVLKDCNWQIHGKNGAAEILDINPSTLRSRLKKLGIEKGEVV